MNIRRWIIYSCCVFAGLILLAHGFIPHIHHDGVICFIHEHKCETSCNGHDHEHNHGPLEDCKLNDIQIRPEVNESITPDLSDQFLLTYHLIFILSEQVPISDICGPEQEYSPYLLLYTSVFTGPAHSLRAPPVSVQA